MPCIHLQVKKSKNVGGQPNADIAVNDADVGTAEIISAPKYCSDLFNRNLDVKTVGDAMTSEHLDQHFYIRMRLQHWKMSCPQSYLCLMLRMNRFWRFIWDIDKKVSLPSRQYLSYNMIPQLYLEKMSADQNHLSTESYISLTMCHDLSFIDQRKSD